MTIVLVLIISICVLAVMTAEGSIHDNGVRDYCILDKFNPHCKDNEVIIINSAKFGRMKSNPCISRDNGPTGCFADVKGILESQCAGRKSCSIMISDQILLSNRPCGEIFNLYLSASYSCLEIHSNNPRRCQGQNIEPITSDTGYFASSVAMETSQMLQQCPWKIKSISGRQLNVTIQRFPTTASQEKTSNPPVCYSAVTIKEKTTVRNVLLCPSDAVNKSVYLSEGGEIELTFANDQGNEALMFLLYYQAVGCSNPVVPNEAKFKRQGNQVIVMCNKSDVRWELICKDDKWQGDERECTVGWAFASAMGEEDTPPLGMLLIIVTGIALGVLIGGFLLYLAINAFKRYHGLLPAQQIQNPSYEKPLYNPNNKLAYNDRTIQRSSMIYGTNRRSYPNRQMPPPVPPPHVDPAQLRPPSEISEVNRQSHIYETPLFNSL